MDKDLCFWMGACLFAIQGAESALASAIECALPEGGIISVASMEADEAEHRRKTVGQLVRKLNDRARIDAGLVERLESFIKQRNEFIHHFSNRFDLASVEGSAEGVEWCKSLTSEAFSLAFVFHSVVCAVVDQLEPITGGAVKVGWDTIPADVAVRMRELVRSFPAIIRERKS
jgi:hypothetical protein